MTLPTTNPEVMQEVADKLKKMAEAFKRKARNYRIGRNHHHAERCEKEARFWLAESERAKPNPESVLDASKPVPMLGSSVNTSCLEASRLREKEVM